VDAALSFLMIDESKLCSLAEVMTLLEATWQEADLLEPLFYEIFDQKPENPLVVICDVET